MAVPRKKANHHQQKTVSFRLPEDLMAKLRDLAKKNRRTISGELQIAIERHLECEDRPRIPLSESRDGQV